MMNPYILVVGSSNTDMVIKADHLPAPGETILGGNFFMNPGGKGANQAVAAARSGGNVTLITKTGNDVFGREAVQIFEQEGINTSHIFSDPDNPSGVALITVDKTGENCIVVASGANATLSPQDLQSVEKVIAHSSVVLMQMEIPVETVAYVARVAKENNVPVVLNPAPACALPDSLLRNISIITPNETEAEILTGIKVTGIETAEKAARALNGKGINTVIVTLGAKGALIFHEDVFTHVPGIAVSAVDTTAAGDVFNGALVVALSEGRAIQEAVSFACKAAAISVTRLGAQASAPHKKEIEAFANASISRS
jgi:ribokinase